MENNEEEFNLEGGGLRDWFRKFFKPPPPTGAPTGASNYARLNRPPSPSTIEFEPLTINNKPYSGKCGYKNLIYELILNDKLQNICSTNTDKKECNERRIKLSTYLEYIYQIEYNDVEYGCLKKFIKANIVILHNKLYGRGNDGSEKKDVLDIVIDKFKGLPPPLPPPRKLPEKRILTYDKVNLNPNWSSYESVPQRGGDRYYKKYLKYKQKYIQLKNQ